MSVEKEADRQGCHRPGRLEGNQVCEIAVANWTFFVVYVVAMSGSMKAKEMLRVCPHSKIGEYYHWAAVPPVNIGTLDP